MKTTIDIPADILSDAMKYSRATTKREVVITALQEMNRRYAMAKLTSFLGRSDTLMSPADLASSRRKGNRA
ncbi:MAG TPA: type II toxin-antitoxin system VapB family antitoxin [Kiritimatiellia bacterium]|nr:type II toxin-antitoxin system VapB family antitoxin [Kiritimatiellia bacterium]